MNRSGTPFVLVVLAIAVGVTAIETALRTGSTALPPVMWRTPRNTAGICAVWNTATSGMPRCASS